MILDETLAMLLRLRFALHVKKDYARSCSSRANVSRVRWQNTRTFGDFHGSVETLLRYYDAQLFIADWGTVRLGLAFPRGAIDPEPRRSVPGNISERLVARCRSLAVNTNLELLDGPVQSPRATRVRCAQDAVDLKHRTQRGVPVTGEAGGLAEIAVVTAARTETAPPRAELREVKFSRSSALRIAFFRTVRVLAGCGIVSAAAIYLRSSFYTATSEQGYINAELTVLRAPISGKLHFENLAPGHAIEAGAPLFRIENARFGNQQSASHSYWARELADRLKVESEEALLQSQQQEKVFELEGKLFAEKLISRLELLQEESKLVLARTIATNKQQLAARAASRVREITEELELQKSASVTMPFAGAAWTVRPREGAEVAAHETIAEVIDPKRIRVDAFFHERHAAKLAVGTRVRIRNLDSGAECGGTVEWVRGGIGRIPFEETAVVAPGDYTRRRVAVRVRPDAGCVLAAGEFFGVGRSVIVTVPSHE